jgi:hypothetical protein
VLGWPAGTVKTRIKAGMTMLRAEMAKLAASPEQLRSTMDSLEQWASRTHRRVADEARPRPAAGARAAGPGELAQGSGSIALPLAAARARPVEGLLDGVPVEIESEGAFPAPRPAAATHGVAPPRVATRGGDDRDGVLSSAPPRQ